MALGEDVKKNLFALRKKTGYPLGNCKKALEAAGHDLGKAEVWLETQAKELGWSRTMLMEDRPTSQGLVGIALDRQHAAMVEVNCETDFVSENDKFRELVDAVAKTCVAEAKTDEAAERQVKRRTLKAEQMEKLHAGGGGCGDTLADLVAKTVGAVGERMVLRRAALLAVGSGLRLAALTHPSADMKGGLGAVLAYAGPDAEVAEQLCQQVMATPPANHAALLSQPFLRDPGRSVAQVADQAGIQVEDFVRFQCGESLPE